MCFSKDRHMIYPFEEWLLRSTHPQKSDVVDTIKSWHVYSHGIRLNEIILDNGKPAYKRSKLFYLPRETDRLIESLAELSISGYRIYAVSKDVLSGIFLEKDDSHQTDIDADIIQEIIDYSIRVSNTNFYSPDVIGKS
jgi:hypothetical protein